MRTVWGDRLGGGGGAGWFAALANGVATLRAADGLVNVLEAVMMVVVGVPVIDVVVHEGGGGEDFRRSVNALWVSPNEESRSCQMVGDAPRWLAGIYVS